MPNDSSNVVDASNRFGKRGQNKKEPKIGEIEKALDRLLDKRNNDSENDNKNKQKKKKDIQPSSTNIGTGHVVSNIQAGRDVKTGDTYNINKRETKRHIILPSPENITPAQAQTIKEKIDKLVEIDVIAGTTY